MSAISIHDIEEQLRHSDPQKRQAILHSLTDLFLSSAPQLDEAGVEVFDNVFDFALDEPGTASLIDISTRMAPVPNAPTGLIKRLANDSEIAVAGPVLSQSPRLSESDLCEIARAKGNTHLLAISARKHLTSPVTDILIDRGDDDVARNVATNETAQLTERGVSRLMERAKADETMSAGLRMRSALQPHGIQNAAAKTGTRSQAMLAKIAAAQRIAVTLKQEGILSETKVRTFAEEEKFEELVASIALMSDLRYDLIESMMQGRRLGGLTLVCKSLGFNMTTMSFIWKLSVSHNRATSDEVRNARKDFLAVSQEIAGRVVRFWLVRQASNWDGGVARLSLRA